MLGKQRLKIYHAFTFINSFIIIFVLGPFIIESNLKKRKNMVKLNLDRCADKKDENIFYDQYIYINIFYLIFIKFLAALSIFILDSFFF